MGAGKGRARRAQTSKLDAYAKSVGSAQDRRRRWRDFAQSSGIDDVKVTQYYLGNNRIPTISDCNKIVSE